MTGKVWKPYIAGDVAGWIKAGREALEKGKFVPDRFHMGKYIDRSVSHLLDSAAEVKEEIYEALEKGKKGRVREIYKKIRGVTEKEGKEKEVEESLRYLMNNWEGIEIYGTEPGGAWGCHAEGQLSHVLSRRMSSRPMGWSRKGADQMSRLRAYWMNGGKEVRRAAAGEYPRIGRTHNEMDAGPGGSGNPIHCLIIPDRIGKKSRAAKRCHLPLSSLFAIRTI